ncbi:KH domain-containing protein [Aerococcus urinae]|uniref:RNA-binding protein KhpA n=1 Tax=Aerococcus urinae TaxID=1376 RepID=A0A0X8FDM6_9LACT|nr:KH domain-containing protein [Aerococcus urinae]AMB95414.1 RNA-binding protein [Aerococcus urinae]MCY3032731.1 KH domain-containing protein [Aerococcus urinae]MCY3038032.1 KH domain-containing protein [Aerococcus urinae]MCY3044778.1 KH domain-containing protein [Aerococcus urinae]MCY3045911.1 KH domain-containing protein [Aerococcus urinae]
MPDIENLLMTIIQPLVSYPEDIQLEVSDGDEFLEYHLMVHPDDVGRVIGKRGRVANAIRTILYSVRVKGHRRVRLTIDRIDEAQ